MDNNIKPLTFGDFYTIVWSMVPEVWRQADNEYGRSLQVLLYTMSQHMYYYFYKKAIHMEELFDPDVCPDKYLKFLAGMVGWNLVGNDPASWREQIKAAPLLYKIRGTQRGLLLAEKLIGYSVFMSELYRDHVGDAVPKERIFNNTPQSIKDKPWFRKALTNLEGELLPGQAESDQFDSFNTTNLVKLDSNGSVIRPRILTSTRKLVFTQSSTTSRYNNITGKYSIARYAKIPRINVVLKYDHDLAEENADGSVKSNNFSGALDLLLQFKPFHVYINNLEVRYSLSEYIFDQEGIKSDSADVHEEFISAINLLMPRAENTITFSMNPAVEQAEASYVQPASPIDNRGVISSVYKIVDLNSLSYTPETSLYSVFKKNLPIKSAHTVGKSILTSIGDDIVSQQEYVDAVPAPTQSQIHSSEIRLEPTIILQPVDAISYDGFTDSVQFTCAFSSTSTDPITVEWFKNAVLFFTTSVMSSITASHTLTVDLEDFDGEFYCRITNSLYQTTYSKTVKVISKTPPVHGVLKYNIAPFLIDPVLDFKSMLSSQQGATTFTESLTTPVDGFTKIKPISYSVGLPSSVITNIVISNQSYRSSVSTTFDTQSITSIPSRPWDLNGLNTFYTANLIPGITQLDLFKAVYDKTMVIVLETIPELYMNPLYVDPLYLGVSQYTTLDFGIDYYFDNSGNIFLNSTSISTKLASTPEDYKFLATGKLHITYLTRTTYKDETSEGIPGRGFRYKTRINTKYSRQFLVNSLPGDTLQTLMPTQVISVDGKTKQKTVLGTKKCKESSYIYNRSSLKNEVVDNYTVVSRDNLNRMDKSKWTVYSPEYTAYYLGDQKITNNWWGNFYQAKFTSAQVPYANVDTSPEAQLANVGSPQWTSALKLLNLTDPKQFLVVRKSDPNRNNIWKRNSCRFVSVPFIRSRRDNLQVFRKDVPTFTRSEESSDYPIDTSAPPRIDNFKYILPDGTDVSLSYFSPDFEEMDRAFPTIDRELGQKAVITSNYQLSYQKGNTYYNDYMSDVSPEIYYNYDGIKEYNIKTSLYAGNIPISRDPALFTGITDGLDKLSLLINGLELVVDKFTVATSGQSIFNLSKNNLYMTWVEVNTGEVASFGYYAPYGLDTFPNMSVFLNGVLLTYGTEWTLSLNKIKSVILSVPTINTDLVEITYQIIPGQDQTDMTEPPLPQIPHTIYNTITTNDIHVIKQGNRFIIDLPYDDQAPCVSWYNKETTEYINSSSVPMEYQPSGYYELAEPNITITVNGSLLHYKKDWLFLLTTTNSIVKASVALSPDMSLSLSVGDNIVIDYFATV